MTKNLGATDKVLRVFGAVFAGVCAVAAPYSLGIRLGVFGATGVYLLVSAAAGTCLGYRLMGRSTCPKAEQS